MQDLSPNFPQIRPPFPDHEHLKCPRCDSMKTKFCYYNNYNLSQPRHFCKSCRRYWTKGGTLRNIPVGGGTRKNGKRPNSNKKNSTSANVSSIPSSASPPPPVVPTFFGLSSTEPPPSCCSSSSLGNEIQALSFRRPWVRSDYELGNLVTSGLSWKGVGEGEGEGEMKHGMRSVEAAEELNLVGGRNNWDDKSLGVDGDFSGSSWAGIYTPGSEYDR